MQEENSGVPNAHTEEQRLQLQRENRNATHVQFNEISDATAEEWCDAEVPSSVCYAAATLAIVAVTWCLLYVNVPPETMAVPGGSVASILMLYTIGGVTGWLLHNIIGMPPRFGMLLAGIIVQNTGLYNVTGWCLNLVSVIRELLLIIALINGGLELDANQLRQLRGVVARLAFLPCLCEVAAASCAAHFILPDFSWKWSFTLGFTLAAVSQGILAPGLFRLKRLGYGQIKGINTLLIAASSLDNIISIVAFRISVGILFSKDSFTTKMIQRSIDVPIGIILGLIWGVFLIYVPPSKWAKIYKTRRNLQKKSKKLQIERSVTAKRSFLLGAGGFLALTGSQWCGYPLAGPLVCLISSFVAGTGWRTRLKNRKCNQSAFSSNDVDRSNTKNEEKSVEYVFQSIWFALQPTVFAFLGTDIKFEYFKGSYMFIEGTIILVLGLIVRVVIVTCSVAIGTEFNCKETIFINIAWLPKASVQAILAPVALDLAGNLGTPEDVECATRLVTITVISILFTAPVGMFGLKTLGTRLLPKESEM